MFNLRRHKQQHPFRNDGRTQNHHENHYNSGNFQELGTIVDKTVLHRGTHFWFSMDYLKSVPWFYFFSLSNVIQCIQLYFINVVVVKLVIYGKVIKLFQDLGKSKHIDNKTALKSYV